MDLKNSTKNQHFLSQSEQRLNAINPGSGREKKYRIFEFDVVDRENFQLSLCSDRGSLIGSTLSIHDLFSFDVLDRKADRYNFEELFYQYESKISSTTDELLRKIESVGENIASEVVNLFAMKLFNFVRNPYSIHKILNTFPMLRSLQPVDATHLANFNKVLAGRKPQQEFLCRKLQISDKEYVEWLGTIFLLLTPLASGGQNFHNETVRGLFESKDLYVMVIIYTYDHHACLLSDRGFSEPLVSGDVHTAYDFNLYSKGFIRYTFTSIDSIIPPGMAEKNVEKFKENKTVTVYHHRNDLKMLEKYNAHVIYQCHEKVFCSSRAVLGAK
ncbi:hypothetical protein [Pseudomonas syringae]|uniref:hypothetical protein n=1 Tax=Pseudomonas syringae TaxID=317 RepID=UPI0023F77F4D|nr:hypothetical protein [Pseudomonas syringae]MDF5777419.1 hypothetical protein [Pseudomonas syringae pv. syringae]